jgi:hypothetical protein
MYSIQLVIALASFLNIHPLLASPLVLEPPFAPLSERVLGDCNDLKQNLTVPCWNQLNMSSYLEDWWHTNGPACTQQNAGFVSCYQQMAGVEQQQCDTTGPSMCDFPTSFANYTAQQANTLYTIFAIWQWFESIYEGIESADMSATGPVGKIVKAINPEIPEKQPLGDLLQALTAMTPLLVLPASFGKAVTSLAETAMRQSPGVLKQLNPTGTLDSEVVQINDLYDGLGTIKTTYQQNVSTALAMVQQNFETFNNLAANGSFIAPRSSLQADTRNLTAALETYIVSQCLTANNIVVTLARDTSPYVLANNGSMTTPNLISCASYDQYGVCSAWSYDPGTNTAYALANMAHPATNYYDLMQAIFSEGWTTGADLFLGAKARADYVAAGGGSNSPALDPNPLVPRCLSNIQVCVWDKSCELTDQNCEFTGEYGTEICKPQEQYLGDGCGGDGGVTTVKVPAAYLGKLDTMTDNDLIVCN